MQQIQKNARFFDFPPDFSCKSAFFSVLYRHNMKGYIMKTEENGIWSDFALEGLEELDK